MDDPAFPDSHYTTTTTTNTTSTVQSPPVTIDKGYITSIPGILRIVEIVVGFLYWILVATCGYGVGFPLFVGISCWVLTICFFIIFVLSLDKRVIVINWLLTELIHNLVWTVLHFVGACIVAARAARGFNLSPGGLGFAAVLGFALMILYGVSTFFNFRVFQAGGGLARLTGGSGAAGGTATTTTVTTDYPAEKGMDAPPPYTNP